MNSMEIRQTKMLRILGSISLLIGIGLTWTPYYQGSPAVHGIAGFFIGCSLPLYVMAIIWGKQQRPA